LNFGDAADASFEWIDGSSLLNIAGVVDFDDNVTMQGTLGVASTMEIGTGKSAGSTISLIDYSPTYTSGALTETVFTMSPLITTTGSHVFLGIQAAPRITNTGFTFSQAFSLFNANPVLTTQTTFCAPALPLVFEELP